MDLRSFAAKQLADVREGGATRLWQKLTPYSKKRGRNKYNYGLELGAARAEASAISSLLDGWETPTVDVVYDNLCSSPAYGDFMEVMMTARYLAARGAGVRFSIVDRIPRRADWDDRLTSHGQEVFVRHQVQMAHALLRDKADITLVREAGSALADTIANPTPGAHVLFGEFVNSRRRWYALAPTLLDQLVSAQGNRIPPGWLLSLSDFPEAAAAVASARPYVAWSIRRTNQVGDVRDSTAPQIASDFRTLARRFPSSKIMVFSTPPALAFAREVLSRSPECARLIAERLVEQPVSDFVGAIPWVLGSDFYFQRVGGGLGEVAIFSDRSYRIVNMDTGPFTGYRGGRLAAWSGDDQRWTVWPVGARYRRIRLDSC